MDFPRGPKDRGAGKKWDTLFFKVAQRKGVYFATKRGKG